MRTVIQRVSEASVEVNGAIVGEIARGLLVLAGFEADDTPDDLEWMAAKIAAMRIFSDDNGKMNLSVSEIGGEILVVSQFTLHASTKKGNRPSFIKAAKPEMANLHYETFKQCFRAKGIVVASGIFGADMKVRLLNDGPVTIVIDSKNKE